MSNRICPYITVSVAALFIPVLLHGCSSSDKGSRGAPGEQRSEGAATPKQAIVNMVKAVENNDKELLLKTMQFPDRELAEMAFESLFALADFVRKFEGAYGKGAAAKAGFRPAPTVSEVEASCRIKMDGERATAWVSSSTPPTQLARIDGQWKILPPGRGPSPDDRQRFLEGSRTIVKVLNEAKRKAGQPGYTAEGILKELVIAIAAVPLPSP